MRSVSRWFRGSAVLLALLTILVTQAAAAKEQQRGDSLIDRFERAKRFVVVIFSRFGLPPG